MLADEIKLCHCAAVFPLELQISQFKFHWQGWIQHNCIHMPSITFWTFWNIGSLIKLVSVALSGFWSVFPTWQVADVVVFSVPPGRHHYRIIWRMCHIMGKLPDDIAAACKSLVVLRDLSWWPRKEYCHHICCLAKVQHWLNIHFFLWCSMQNIQPD